ncbi:sensor histidine kinase [Paenibacillus lactis]|uniref:Integral membrane sensor signal transduction histidine kinase n=1 Tax=Paenibacillus lactis 154 TaxID=743719 RepID=G4HIV1_9BACL|nr:sensor histidine kinase [Paenibacillus lactis]EHB62669.1 integral membrane sensor signal transduction histidine kinase [Paenibacillus lactis 154]
MINPFKKYRIDSLFIICFAGLITIVLAITVWTSYAMTSRELADNTSYYQKRLLEELNNEITGRLTSIEQISLTTSRDNDLLTFLSGKEDEFNHYRRSKGIQEALAHLTYSIPQIQAIDLYMEQPEWGDRQSYIQFHELKAAEAQPWYPLLQNNDFSWSEEHDLTTYNGNVPVLSFSRKVYNNSRYLGILVVHVKADWIRGILEGYSKDSNRMLLDLNGRELLSVGTSMKDAGLQEHDLRFKDQSGVLRLHTQPHGVEPLVVYSKVADSNWMLVEITPWERITSGSVKLAGAIITIGIGALLLAFLLTLWLSRQLLKPIAQLVRAMKNYDVGGKQAELAGDYTNEFGILFAGFRRLNERIQALYASLAQRYEQQRKAEIEALQANINPHFLYNTLDQLNWMAIAEGQEKMSRILELMGRMFRIGLSHGESFITIDEELTHVACYLEIQQIRWEEGLEYEVQASQEVRNLFIPKMTLQPFVENSIIHGFNARQSGRIQIKAEEEDGRVRMTITDDGSGLAPESKGSHRRKGGYGIRNVRERFSAFFNENYEINVKDGEFEGVVVTIIFPRLEEAQT